MRFLKTWHTVVVHKATLHVSATIMISHNALSKAALGIMGLHAISVLGGYAYLSLFGSF